jgi:SAM-dependent methyltransferase
MICTGQGITEITISEDKYYNTPAGKFKTAALKDFHNLYVKKRLILGAAKQGDTLIDFACGKAGDLPKWINAKLSFVFGVDISKDNLENRIDGACARFLNLKKSTKNMPYALFVNGNSAFNIKNGSAMLNEKAKQITAAIFGNGPKEAEKIGRGVSRQYGRGVDGFNVSSCQFAIHYFFETPDTLREFVKNVAECTKHNGYFIGTCYDGKLVFNELKKSKTGESIKIIENDKKIWEITKAYGADIFEDDSSSIGYRIDVYQESINQVISEYLVNFDYFNRVMSAFGFEVISRDEAKEFGLPEGSGLFSELFLYMLDEIAKNKFKAKDFDEAPFMTSIEKKISFLNRYFIYKKVRTVNTEAITLELGEYNETAALRNKIDTERAQKTAKKEVVKEKEAEEKSTLKKKVRKLSKKLLLVPGTEALDETKPVTKKPPSKKLLIVESDSD